MKIIAYFKTGCPWCEDARDFLENKKISFEERNVTENKEYFIEMQKKSGQTKAPTFDIDGEILADSDKEALEKYLVEHGTIL